MATIIRRLGCVLCACGFLCWAGWHVVHAHKANESTTDQAVVPVAYTPTVDPAPTWLNMGLTHLENGTLEDAEFCLCEHLRDHPKHL